MLSSFIVFLATMLTSIFLGVFLFIHAGSMAGKIGVKVKWSELNKKIFLRFIAVSIIVISCIVTVTILPHTRYGGYLIGKYYFEIFLKSHSIEAAEKAFSLWQRTANKEAFLEVLEKIPQDSPAWNSFIGRSSRIYYQKGNMEAYESYLLSLENKLQHDFPKSALYMELGNLYRNTDRERAENYYNMVISLKNNKGDMDRARGNIYEMHNLNIGQKSPDFFLKTIKNKEISLASLQGKIVLLDFWSIHCGGCLHEIPMLQNLYKKVQSDKFVMVGISLEHGEEVLQFIEKNNLPWQHVLVNQMVSPEILDVFNIQFVPSTYIIDTEGNIAYKNLRGEELEKTIFQLLQ